MALAGGASALTARFDCTTAYLATVDYFTYALVRTDADPDVAVLAFTTTPTDANYVAKGTLIRTGDTCTFGVSQAAIPGTDNDRGTFKLQLVRRRVPRAGRARVVRAAEEPVLERRLPIQGCVAACQPVHGHAPGRPPLGCCCWAAEGRQQRRRG